jgi:hypothetical protein
MGECMIFRMAGALVVALALLVACGGPPCAVQAAPYVADVERLSVVWDQAARSADAIPANELPGQLNQVTAARDAVQALTPPACAQEAHQALVGFMNERIQVYLALQAGDLEAAKAHAATSQQHYDHFGTLLRPLQATATP